MPVIVDFGILPTYQRAVWHWKDNNNLPTYFVGAYTEI